VANPAKVERMNSRKPSEHQTAHVGGALLTHAWVAKDFFAEPSITELAKSQHVKPFKDLSSFAGGIPEDQDIDEFLGEIYAARK